MKKEKDATKETFNGTAFAQFLFGPRRRQTGAVLLSLGVPGHDGDGSQTGVNPMDQLKAPIAGIQADNTRMDLVEPL